MVSTSTMVLNPDIEETFALRGWYDSIGSSSSFQAHSSAMSGGMSMAAFNRSEMRSLLDVKDSQLGMNDKVEYFSSRATIMHIKNDNISYQRTNRLSSGNNLLDHCPNNAG
jgi:replication factor A1